MTIALLEKDVVKPTATESDTGPVPYHWTVDALYRALDAGVFEHPERLELIQGRIIENMGQNPPHRSFRVRLARRLQSVLQPPFFVVDECPVHIAEDSEPTPDIVVLYGEEADYDDRHPTPPDVAVAVEISASTIAYDLGGKALLYARAGIAEYWVVLVNGLAIVRHREPTPEGYQSVTRLAGDDTLSPLAMPDAVWIVNALLGREEN